MCNFVYNRRSKKEPETIAQMITQTKNHFCSFECVDGNCEIKPGGVTKAGSSKGSIIAAGVALISGRPKKGILKTGIDIKPNDRTVKKKRPNLDDGSAQPCIDDKSRALGSRE